MYLVTLDDGSTLILTDEYFYAFIADPWTIDPWLAAHMVSYRVYEPGVPPEPEPEPEPEPIPRNGTIIRKELEFSGSGDGTVPVLNVPIGVRAKLHVWGRNDSNTSQPIGIYWFVNDPDGGIAEEYTDWKFGTLGPGQTHEFISSGQFDLNKPGRYGTWIELLMGSPEEIVDRYIGHLCTVAVLEYKGSIARKELEYDETRSIIPVY